MKSIKESNTPPDAIRWCIIITALWILNGATLIYWTYSSLRKPLAVGGTLIERIAATDDQAKQQEFNLRMAQAIDNRVAAAKSLQHRVIFLTGGVMLTGGLHIWFLIGLRRSLRHHVSYELRSIAELDSRR